MACQFYTGTFRGLFSFILYFATQTERKKFYFQATALLEKNQVVSMEGFFQFDSVLLSDSLFFSREQVNEREEGLLRFIYSRLLFFSARRDKYFSSALRGRENIDFFFREREPYL